MEGVGARLGRSSTRYGPATVFTGPVRKWKKKWVHVASSSSATSSNANANGHALHNGTANGAVNGSHLLLYKWTPTTLSQNSSAANNGNGNVSSSKDDSSSDEPPKRRFKYVPIAVLEEQKYEAVDDEVLEKDSDEAKAIDVEESAGDDNLDEKPDINDVPMDENEDTNKVVCQDLNESTLDLSLGLNGHDDDNEPDSNDNDRRES